MILEISKVQLEFRLRDVALGVEPNVAVYLGLLANRFAKSSRHLPRRQATLPGGDIVAAGVALAETIFCSTNPCTGTTQTGYIAGTNNSEEIRALDGNDTVDAAGGSDKVYGGVGVDEINGDAQFDEFLDGDDQVYGGSGYDHMWADGGGDLLSGGGGNDAIDAREDAHAGPHPPGADTVKGGRGNDSIDTIDGMKDIIDCGKGRNNSVIQRRGDRHDHKLRA